MKIRFVAAACHFGLSALVVSAVFGLIVGIWYPQPFFYAQGLSKILILMVSVDLVLGPLLTLIVFNPAKPRLRYDLMVIALIQFGALSYGVYSTFISRPVYVVYAGDRFNAVSPNEYLDSVIKKVPHDNPYLQFPLAGPRWIGAVMPPTVNALDRELIDITRFVGGGLRIFPQYYVAFEQVKAEALRSGKRASELNLKDLPTQSIVASSPSPKKHKARVSIEQVSAVKSWLAHLDVPLEKVVLLPLKGFQNYAIVALHADTGKVLDTLSQDPWWYE